MTNTAETLPYIPTPLLISTSLLTSSQLVAQFEDFRGSLQYVSVAPGLVFERLVTNLNGAINAALEVERQQHASDLKVSQASHDEFQEELAKLKRTNQELVQTLGACTCSRTSITGPPTNENPKSASTLTATAARTKSNPRTGTFDTDEIHSWLQPCTETSKTIPFDPPYPAPPGIPVGLTNFSFGLTGNLRIHSHTRKITTDQFEINIDSWEDLRLPSAACSWLEIEADDPDFQFGIYNTQVDQSWDKCQALTTREITFQRAYDAPPVVVVWLTGFDMDKEYSCRIRTFAESVTATGFTINIATSGDSVLYSAVSSWVAYTAGIPGVCSGRFSTLDLRPSHIPENYTSGYVAFGEKAFSTTPRIMLVINSVDVVHSQGLDLFLEPLSISADGMQWQLDTTLRKPHSAGASYIAMS